jgi:endoglucanase
MYIDIGVSSKEEVEKLNIRPGDMITPKVSFEELANPDYLKAKAFDNRVGCACAVEVMKNLYKEYNSTHFPLELYSVGTVQEEVGLRGAKMITETIKPDLAICFDVCFDTNTPMIKKDVYGDFKMGEGVVFRQGKDTHINLVRHMKKVANNNEIPFKVSVGGGGGTNTFSYYLSNGGVVTSTLSIPLRGMHTPNEMINLDDVETAINFYVNLLTSIEYKHDFKLV